MKKEISQQEPQEKKSKFNEQYDKIRDWIVFLINYLIIALVCFFFIAIVGNLAISYFKISKSWVLPLLFLFGFTISIFVSRVVFPKMNVGNKVLIWYENLLSGMIKYDKNKENDNFKYMNEKNPFQ